MRMTCNNKDLLKIWDELQDIFSGNKKFSVSKTCRRLNKLGFETKHSNSHIKCFVEYNNKRHCITISTTGSDNYAGWQVLQDFRRVYERGNEK